MQIIEYDFKNSADYTFPESIDVENGVVRLVKPYVTSNPAIIPTAPMSIDMLVRLEIGGSAEAGNDIKHTVEIAGVEYWWDGAAWVPSSGYIESNTAAEITAFSRYLEILSHTKTCRIVTYLHSSGSYTPTLSHLWVTVGTYAESIVEPSKTKVWGWIRNAEGEPVKGVGIKAWIKNPVAYGKVMITPHVVEGRSQDNGYFELMLVDNEGMKYFPDAGIGKPYYVFNFRGAGFKTKEARYVPKVGAVEYMLLEKIIGGAE